MQLRPRWVVPIALIAGFAMAQQSAQQPRFLDADEATLISVAGAPECQTFAVEHGDPKAGSSVTLIKFGSGGCTVPMHWHSANEQVLVVSGTAKVETQGEKPHIVKPGGYYFMPARHQHQFSCASGCTVHRILDGPLDIHYIDAAGNEISAEKALAAVGERPAQPVTAKTREKKP